MKPLNIGILAHVDAGKTSLTERLLFNAGVIKTLGSVDQGNTQTDSMALERKRGITIRSAVVSFDIGNFKINLIDTPGHPDFIAEVERALGVLDAVVLVISAVEGVQSQTRVLMRTLKKLHIPTFIFINKVDRMGARDAKLINDIKIKLFPDVVAMNSVMNIGTRQATIITGRQNPKVLAVQVGKMQLCPVFFGSAATGVGVSELADALEAYLTPSPATSSDSLSAVVFKIERGSHDEKVAYIRMYSGSLQTRNRVELHRVEVGGANTSSIAKVTAMQLFQNGATVEVSSAQAGEIVKVWGLSNCFIGDYLGRLPLVNTATSYFLRPSLEVVVVALKPEDRIKLYAGLTRMSEQDPLIEVRQRKRDGALSVRLYGEVQKEVIRDTLVNDFGIAVEFREMTTIYIERPIGVGIAVEMAPKERTATTPFLATVGLRVEPAPINSGVQFRLDTKVLGTMPPAFFKAVEDAVYEALQQGIYGWEVMDCVATMTHSGFWPRQSHSHGTFDKNMSSTAGDFRDVTPLVLMSALKQAGTDVYEPISHFELDIPSAVLSSVLQGLTAHEANLDRPPTMQHDSSHLEGVLPARRTNAFERNIPDLTQGEGTFTAVFGGYQKVTSAVPIRERTDNNPLDKEEYLRRTLNRG